VADRWASVPIPLNDGLTVLRLRHREKGGCTFLNATLDQGRCAAHAHRPGSCRLYPLTVRVAEVTNEVGTDSLCPLRWARSPELETAAARDWRRWRADVAHEKRLVRAWVKAGGEKHPWNVFSAFALQWAQHKMHLAMPQAFFPR
jgi:Fe-S-cluster containining protein